MTLHAPIRCSSTPLLEDDTATAEIGIVGIGNTLMGDDGAGIVAAEKLKCLFSNDPGCFFYTLRSDLFEVADVLDRAERFFFIDAFIGKPPGKIMVVSGVSSTPLPSLHQTDIGTVMRMLEPLHLCVQFPAWEIWGIAVEPPFLLGAGLSPAVSAGVEETVQCISAILRSGRSRRAPAPDRRI